MHFGRSTTKLYRAAHFHLCCAIGLVLSRAVSAVHSKHTNSCNGTLIACLGHNHTTFSYWSVFNQIRKGTISETYQRPDYEPPANAQILAYGESCDEVALIGQILNAGEHVDINIKGVELAFGLLAFSNCLITAFDLRMAGQYPYFVLGQNQEPMLCVNSTTYSSYSYEDIPTPWFISPGALRWLTIVCSGLAILRAYG
ncbi:ORF3 [Kibale red-tailed guenon virus 1]|uniref:ORF3 n=1 Tax=Kibale red-tailed guenon virus 1 TaxID=1965065 RepID=L0CSE5_9NIDO|nr:ORF3 [Kibale red-tailed guenon virus 1]AGA19105.1 ORF3 [Kibale red-tailed guenon virus 1]